MQLGKLDHVNVRTARPEAMVAWYERVLGMPSGWRPNFPFPGAWLYVGDHPCVHLVGVDADPAGGDPRLEHFAFSATGLETFVARLAKEGVAYDMRPIAGAGLVQIHLADPDGNHIHIDFPEAEAAGLAL